MFRIRKYNFHFWIYFPNLSSKIAAKMAQKAKIAAKSPQKTGSKLTQKKDPMKAYILTRGLVPVLTI